MPAGELAVVGVLLQEGPSEPNPALQFALRLAPEAAGEGQAATGQSMQIDTILPCHDGYRHDSQQSSGAVSGVCWQDESWGAR